MLQRLGIFIDVASALDYLHNGYSEPVVHSDLKPSNILLDENIVGHLSDFGIAKLLGVEDFFIRTKTSDEMFTGDLSLKLWVNDSHPTGVTQIVDADLIRPTEEPLNPKIRRCLVSIMTLALSCTSASPDARINMKEALLALKKIRLQFITT